MKQLTAMSTEELRTHLDRWPRLRLPGKATLNSVCRDYGLAGPAPELRTQRQRPLGHLRMQVFRGWFTDKRQSYDLALVYETWSGALSASLKPDFSTQEDVKACLHKALNAFPPEYRRCIRTFHLLQREPPAHMSNAWLEDAESDYESIGNHTYIHIGRFMYCGQYMEYGYFSHLLAKLVGHYNFLYAARQRRRLKEERGLLSGFSNLSGPVNGIGRVAEVGMATDGCAPALRVFAALSSLTQSTARGPRPKYSLEDICQLLSPDVPRRGRKRAKSGAIALVDQGGRSGGDHSVL